MSLTVDATGNPIKVTGTTAVSEAIVAAGHLVKVRGIYWYAPTNEGHLCAVLDGNGKDIVRFICDTSYRSQWIPIDESYDGIFSDDMDSGTLYIYQR